jgi:hypothetical protein
VDSEKFDIMWYAADGSFSFDDEGHGPGAQDLMTKEEAKEFAKDLPPGDYIIGWTAGTCRSRFQLWVPEKGLVVEIPHERGLPEGRRAAILAQKARHRGEA